VVEHLLRVDHAEEFAEALQAGWEGLWTFGQHCAREIWNDKPVPVISPYCVVMNIAALARFDGDTCDRIRRNLNVILYRTTEEQP
jgi:hypothetical protein